MVHDHDDFCLQVEFGDHSTDALGNMHAASVAAIGAFGTGTHDLYCAPIPWTRASIKNSLLIWNILRICGEKNFGDPHGLKGTSQIRWHRGAHGDRFTTSQMAKSDGRGMEGQSV